MEVQNVRVIKTDGAVKIAKVNGQLQQLLTMLASKPGTAGYNSLVAHQTVESMSHQNIETVSFDLVSNGKLPKTLHRGTTTADLAAALPWYDAMVDSSVATIADDDNL